jgi:CHAD domain-containing protein
MVLQPKRLWPDSATILERSRGVFFAYWEELLRLRRVVLKTSDLNDIHDLRVASRRFRAALELFYPLAPKCSKTELRRSVRCLTRILGGLRNIDEAHLFFQQQTSSQLSDNTRLYAKLSRRRDKELTAIRKSLKEFDHVRYDKKVREIVAGVNEASIARLNSISLLAFFSDVSIRLYLPIHTLFPVSIAPDQRSPRHALRIAIKKWRYFFEIIALILNRDYTHVLELLKEYQSILGQMNDIVEFGLLITTCKLPADERTKYESILRTEEVALLERFTSLVEQTPLTYTFLI